METYAFPSLPVGTYELEFQAPGFRPLKRTGIVINADSALKEDAKLELAQQTQEVTVSENADAGGNGEHPDGRGGHGCRDDRRWRSTAGVSRICWLCNRGSCRCRPRRRTRLSWRAPRSRLPLREALNPGNQSISGQREDANGFMINGGDVKELMNGGTSIVPNLDSIAEFRILTNNFDAQYGNYSGGIVNVVTKSGAQSNPRQTPSNS